MSFLEKVQGLLLTGNEPWTFHFGARRAEKNVIVNTVGLCSLHYNLDKNMITG